MPFPRARALTRDSLVDASFSGKVRRLSFYTPFDPTSLADEYRAPDLWSSVREERELVEAASGAEGNEPFDDDSKERIRSYLEELGSSIHTSYAPDEEQSEFIRRRLTYLTEAADRQGRQDWLHTIVAVLLSIIWGATLAPDQAADLFRVAAQLLKTYLQIKFLRP